MSGRVAYITASFHACPSKAFQDNALKTHQANVTFSIDDIDLTLQNLKISVHMSEAAFIVIDHIVWTLRYEGKETCKDIASRRVFGLS